MNGDTHIKVLEFYERKCKCKPACKTYYRINGFDVYCENHMRGLAQHIFDFVGEGTTVSPRGWSPEQDEALIEWATTNKEKRSQNEFVKWIGKHKETVRLRVKRLKKEGRII